MMKLEKMTNVEFCEICDNYTPSVHIEEAGEYGCQNCYEAYGVEMMEFQKMKIKKVSDYQKEYDKLKAIAESSINANVELDDSFYNELLRLTKLVKSFGGKV